MAALVTFVRDSHILAYLSRYAHHDNVEPSMPCNSPQKRHKCQQKTSSRQHRFSLKQPLYSCGSKSWPASSLFPPCASPSSSPPSFHVHPVHLYLSHHLPFSSLLSLRFFRYSSIPVWPFTLGYSDKLSGRATVLSG